MGVLNGEQQKNIRYLSAIRPPRRCSTQLIELAAMAEETAVLGLKQLCQLSEYAPLGLELGPELFQLIVPSTSAPVISRCCRCCLPGPLLFLPPPSFPVILAIADINKMVSMPIRPK